MVRSLFVHILRTLPNRGLPDFSPLPCALHVPCVSLVSTHCGLCPGAATQLTGTIPPPLFLLPALGSLDLGDNQLTGTIPQDIG